ncbi:MAG: YigZ family protein [Myxococcota bacterium]
MPKTIASPSTFVAAPIKGSRFTATIAPCTTSDEALAVVAANRARWPDASHHCWAFRLASGDGRSHDDGEPGGSAGRPILAQIDGHDVVDVVVVVARWFGGTKLGVGGLIRAYGGCAGQGLDRAEVADFVEMADVWIRFGHPDTGDVHHVLTTHGVEIVDTTYSETVRMKIRLPQAIRETVLQALADRTKGRVSESPAA